MPTNPKEGLIFTSLMCFLMVLGMSIYNLALHDALTFSNFITGFVPGFIVALLLDMFIIGRFAKQIAFSLPINKNQPLQLILTITCLMVIGMVTCMSLFGVIMENGLSNSLLTNYITAWKVNLIAALPLQLVIVGPFSRKILALIQSKQPENN
ncbi:DUF2798 domain-containing protein [Vagococcus penaei]|uniref:DUF2798 domain-containing protein n=1 Tax=Vagococcus penaei TaxID=633807 RepID=A0A1Q2D4P7_9ENTE|nr:DUF2798 domain-containing protein [Vagococcus penaei]AQP53372.1 DUF2798 domain-containing protein [Vagococcus penaei]RST99695.1 DUF2798 domain-containing protein [Vagococcus penaei]